MMFLSRPSAVVRRASRATLQRIAPPPRIPRRQSVPCSRPVQQHRAFAMRAPSVMRSPSVRKRNSPKPDEEDVFDIKHVPPVSFFRRFEFWKEYESNGVTAEDCHRTALLYCETVKTGKEQALLRGVAGFNVDPLILHLTSAAMMMPISPTPRFFLGFRMTLTASMLGFTPATLSIVYIMIQTGIGFGKKPLPRIQGHIRDTEERFRRLLQTEKNPDAFTMQGLMLVREDRADNTPALRYFDRAIAAAPPERGEADAHAHAHAAPREPLWTWEGLCHLHRGRILAKQGRTDEALAAFRILALELDHAQGYLELAKLLPRDAPERETYLVKAAWGGEFEASDLLALDLADKALRPGLAEDERVEAANLAFEWALRQPDPQKRQMTSAEVRHRVGDLLRSVRVLDSWL